MTITLEKYRTAQETARADIVAEAQSWLGTPFVHRASVRGGGADCVGLIRGIWRGFLGSEPFDIPPYTTDWRHTGGVDILTQTLRRHFVERPIGQAQDGDIIVFRMRLGAPARHCGIVAPDKSFIHAYYGKGVVESNLVAWWERRISSVFAFPILSNSEA